MSVKMKALTVLATMAVSMSAMAANGEPNAQTPDGVIVVGVRALLKSDDAQFKALLSGDAARYKKDSELEDLKKIVQGKKVLQVREPVTDCKHDVEKETWWCQRILKLTADDKDQKPVQLSAIGECELDEKPLPGPGGHTRIEVKNCAITDLVNLAE